MNVCLYPDDEALDRVRRKIQKMNASPPNKKLLLDFGEDCLAGWKVPKISKSRTVSLLQKSSRLTVELRKEWMWFDEDDAKRLLQWIDKTYPENGKAWSQHFYKITLRKFVTWLRKKHGYPSKYPGRKKLIDILPTSRYAPEVGHMYIKQPDQLRDAQSIPTNQEMEWLCEAAINLRDRAWIEMSREHGERIGALGTRQIKHIKFDSLGAIVTMHDKTFRGEPVRYISSVMYLRQWFEKHPFNKNPEAPLWIDVSKLPACVALDYDCFRAILRRLIERHNKRAEKQGLPLINKKITTHLFRYYAQTRDEKRGMPRSIMCKIRGWKLGSKQPDHYARLSLEDVDDYWREQYGLKEEGKEKEPIPKIMKCMRCKEINAPGMQFCCKCGLPLDEKAVIGIEEGAEMIQRLLNVDMVKGLIDARVAEILQNGVQKKEKKSS